MGSRLGSLVGWNEVGGHGSPGFFVVAHNDLWTQLQKVGNHGSPAFLWLSITYPIPCSPPFILNRLAPTFQLYHYGQPQKTRAPWFPTFWVCVHKSLWTTKTKTKEPWPPTFWSCVHNGIRAYVYFATQNNMISNKQGNRKVGIHGPLLFFQLQNVQSTITHSKTDQRCSNTNKK